MFGNSPDGRDRLFAQNSIGSEHAHRRDVFCESRATANLVVQLMIKYDHAATVATLQHSTVHQFVNRASQCVAIDAESGREITFGWKEIAGRVQIDDILFELMGNLCVQGLSAFSRDGVEAHDQISR